MISDEDELIPTRRSLLSRLKNWDDQESWRVFFDTYWKLIYNVAKRAGLTEPEAQDVVQETIVSVLKSMADFSYQRTHASFKTWLLQLTSWRIRDQLRRRKAQGAYGAPEQPLADTEEFEELPDPASLDWKRAWDTDWEQNLMDAAVQRVKTRVDAKSYQIFDLLVYKDWDVLRVARAMGVNRAQVYLAKHRVSKLLKEEVALLQKEDQLREWSVKAPSPAV